MNRSDRAGLDRLTLAGASLAAWLLAAAATSAKAQGPDIYRCGNEYRHHPCADGRVLGLREPPGDDEVSSAREVADRQRRLADSLAQDRRRLEAAAVPGPAGIVQRARGGLGAQGEPSARKPGRRGSGREEREEAERESFTAFEPAAAARERRERGERRARPPR